MAAANATIKFFIRAVSDIQISRYLSAVSVTLIIYDWLLLFRIESQTIWPSRWTVPKVLYYYIRLITLPFIVFASYELIDFRPALSKAFCAAWPAMITVPMFTTFAASNWLFTLRLIALYKRQKFLVWFMRIFYVLTYGATLSMLTAALIKYRETVDYFAQVKACGALEASPMFPAMFYAPAAYELLIFALTAHQAYRDASVITNSNSAPFLIVLYRDGLLCFLIMLGIRSWNIWIYVAEPITSLSIGTNIFWTANTILSTRVYLNLVWIYQKPTLSSSMNPGATTSNPNGGAWAMRGTGMTGVQITPPTMVLTYATNTEGGFGWEEDSVWGYESQSSRSPARGPHSLVQMSPGPLLK